MRYLFRKACRALLVWGLASLSPAGLLFAGFVLNGGTVTIANNVVLVSTAGITLTSGSLVANNSQIIVGTTWTRTGGSFTQGTSTVTFNDPVQSALVGSTSFYAIRAVTAGSTVYFTAGTTNYVTNTLGLDQVVLRSTTNNATWYLRLSGTNQSVTEVDVRDSNASGGTAIQAINSQNSGNNTNWTFGATDIGKRYWVGSTAGNWNSSANWSLYSNGTTGASVPSSTHTVIFDGAGGKNGNCSLASAITVATLTISGYGGIFNTTSYDITVSSSFTQDSGTVILGTSIFSLKGDLTRTGGNFAADTSTITFTGTQAQTLTSGSTGFYHVVVNKTGGALTLLDDLDMRGNFTQQAGTFDSAGLAIDVFGNWNFLGGTFDLANSTVAFSPAVSATLAGSTTFYALRSLSSNATLYFTAGTTQYISNLADLEHVNLRSTNPGTRWSFDYSGSSQTFIDVDVRDSDASSGSLLLPDGLSTDSGNNRNWVFGDKRYWVATGPGNWNNTANWSQASGGSGGAGVPTSTHSVVFDGNGGTNGTATMNMIVNVATITVSGFSGTLNTSGATVTINNLFYQDSGLVSVGTSAITLQGDFTRAGGSFSTGASTFTFSGTAAQTLTSGSTGLFNMVVSKTGNSLKLGDDLNLGGQLIVANGTFDTDPANSYASTSTLINIQGTGTFNANSSTVTVFGSTGTLFTKAGTFNYGTSRVAMLPNATVTLTSNNSITFYDLALSPNIGTSRAYSFGTSSLTVYRDLIIDPDGASAATLTVNLGSTTIVLGNTSVQGNGVVASSMSTTGVNRPFTGGNLFIALGSTFSANASVVTLDGDSGILLNSAGYFVAGTSLLQFNADADVTLTDGNLTLSTVTLAPTLTTNRQYSFGDGVITISSNLMINPIKSTAGTARLNVTLGSNLVVATAAATTISGTTNGFSTFDTGNNFALQTGRILINNNGTFNANNSTITINGFTNPLFTRLGAFDQGNSNVEFKSNAAVTLTSNNFFNFHHLTLSPILTTGRAYTLGTSSLAIDGDFTMNPSGSLATLTVNLGSSTIVLGTTTVDGSGQATTNLTTVASWPLTTAILNIVNGSTVTANAATITLNGDSGVLFTRTGTFTQGTSTVDMDSDADVTLTNGAITFNNLSLTPSLTANHTYAVGSGAITVGGNLTITPVKTSGGNATLDVNMGADISVAAAGTVTIGGTTNAYSVLDTIAGSNYDLAAGKINIQSNGTFTANGSTITLSGTTATLFTNAGTFNQGTSSVLMNPNVTINPITSGPLNFFNLSFPAPVSGNRVYTFGSSSVTIFNNLDVNPGPTGNVSLTVNLGSATVVIGTTTIRRTTANGSAILATTASNFPFETGNLSIEANGTFTANGSAITLTGLTSPLITRAGTFTQGTSIVTVTSQADATLNSGTITFASLDIDTPNRTITTGAVVTITDNLTISNGTLDDGGFQLTGNTPVLLTMNAGTEMMLGNAVSATAFPTAFTAGNIFLDVNSTVTYNSNLAQAISGVPTYGNLALTASGAVVKTAGANVTVARNFDIGASNTYSSSASQFFLSVGGDYNNNGVFSAGTSTVTFNSASSGNEIAGNLTGTSKFNNVVFAGGGGWTNTSAMVVGGTMTVTNGTLSGTNDVTVNCDVVGSGSAGTINMTGGTFEQNLGGSGKFFGTNTVGANDWTFNNLTFSNAGATNRISTMSASGTGSIVVSGTLSIGDVTDSTTTTVNDATNNRIITANDVTITNRGAFQASGTKGLSLSGNWTNNGAFTTNNSTVTFNGAGTQNLSGSTTFYGLAATTSGGILKFSAATTFYALRSVDFEDITLRSTTDNATWYFKYTGSSQTLLNLDVKDSNASAGTVMQSTASVNSGNNTNWDFGIPDAITNLTALITGYGRTIDLTWTAPGDDGALGTLFSSTFTIQYTTAPAFAAWSPTTAMPSYVFRLNIATTNVAPGLPEIVRITGLSDGSTYYFRAWTKDDVGNYSPISNGATNWTTSQILSVDLATDTLTLPVSIDLSTAVVISTGIVVTNTGNVNETYQFHATTGTVGTSWSIQPAQGTDQFVLWAIVNPTEPTPLAFGNEDRLAQSDLACTSTVISNGGETCVAVPPGETRTIWFKLGMPLLTSTGAPQKIQITGTATAAP